MYDITTLENTILTERTIQSHIDKIDRLDKIISERALSALNYEERAVLGGVFLYLKSTLNGIKDGDSPFLLSVWTDELNKIIGSAILEEAGDKFVELLNEDEKNDMIALEGAFSLIDYYFRHYEDEE